MCCPKQKYKSILAYVCILDLMLTQWSNIVLILTTAVVSAFHLHLKKDLLNIVFHVAENPVYKWF